MMTIPTVNATRSKQSTSKNLNAILIPGFLLASILAAIPVLAQDSAGLGAAAADSGEMARLVQGPRAPAQESMEVFFSLPPVVALSASFRQSPKPSHRPQGSISGSFMVTDECIPPTMGNGWAMVDFLRTLCSPYEDPMTARLHELQRVLDRSRQALQTAPLGPDQPQRPSDSIGGQALLTPARVRSQQLDGLARFNSAVDQVLRARQTAGRRTPPSSPRGRTQHVSPPQVHYASLLEGAARLGDVLRQEVVNNPNARSQQNLLRSVDGILRDLGTLAPRLNAAPRDARRAYMNYVRCMAENRQAEAQAQAESDRLQGEQQDRVRSERAGWERYLDCRRHQRARQAAARRQAQENAVDGAAATESESPFDEYIPTLMPADLIPQYRAIIESRQLPALQEPAVPPAPTDAHAQPATAAPATQAE